MGQRRSLCVQFCVALCSYVQCELPLAKLLGQAPCNGCVWSPAPAPACAAEVTEEEEEEEAEEEEEEAEGSLELDGFDPEGSLDFGFPPDDDDPAAAGAGPPGGPGPDSGADRSEEDGWLSPNEEFP